MKATAGRPPWLVSEEERTSDETTAAYSRFTHLETAIFRGRAAPAAGGRRKRRGDRRWLLQEYNFCLEQCRPLRAQTAEQCVCFSNSSTVSCRSAYGQTATWLLRAHSSRQGQWSRVQSRRSGSRAISAYGPTPTPDLTAYSRASWKGAESRW